LLLGLTVLRPLRLALLLLWLRGRALLLLLWRFALLLLRRRFALLWRLALLLWCRRRYPPRWNWYYLAEADERQRQKHNNPEATQNS
jgi:hypothetical protein